MFISLAAYENLTNCPTLLIAYAIGWNLTAVLTLDILLQLHFLAVIYLKCLISNETV